MDGSAGLHRRFDRAFAIVQGFVEAGRIPGAVLGIVDRHAGSVCRAAGFASIVPEARPMQVETWFDLASLTKVVFTTPRILALHVAGRIDLDAPLISVIPDLRQHKLDAFERHITFRQCLGHQTPLPATAPIYTYGDNPKRLRHFILQNDWAAGPAVYSDLNFILLGIALERIEGKPIREQDPGNGFAFSAPPDRAAATEYCAWRETILCGEVHDENCAALEGAGHAGLFGTMDALLSTAADWLERDRADDPIVQLMRTPVSHTRSHGWELASAGWPGGDRTRPGTIGHTGFTGTGLWIDFEGQRAWSLLTNRVHPSRFADSGIAQLRRMVGDAISSDG